MMNGNPSDITNDEKNDTLPQIEPLTERMRKKSRHSHDQSDKAINTQLSLLLSLSTSKILYGEAIAIFAPIFQTLEDLAEKHQNHPQLGPLASLILDEDVARHKRFSLDITYFLEDKSTHVPDPPQLSSYISHLCELERKDPVLLMPYIYHMYMAIMAGGFMIRRIVKRAFSLKDNQGIMALSFPDSVNTRKIRSKIKLCINDTMKINKEQERVILDESIRVFILNGTLIDSLKESQTFKLATNRWKKACTGIFLSVTFVTLASLIFKVKAGKYQRTS